MWSASYLSATKSSIILYVDYIFTVNSILPHCFHFARGQYLFIALENILPKKTSVLSCGQPISFTCTAYFIHMYSLSYCTHVDSLFLSHAQPIRSKDSLMCTSLLVQFVTPFYVSSSSSSASSPVQRCLSCAFTTCPARNLPREQGLSCLNSNQLVGGLHLALLGP